MNLFELTEEYKHLLDMAVTATTEEEQQAFADTLDGLSGEIKGKVINCAYVCRTLELHAVAIKAHQDQIAKKLKTATSRVEQIKTYMMQRMTAAGLKEVEGEIFTVAIRSGHPAVEMAEGTVLGAEYLRIKQTYEPDKVAISKALKAGVEIPGCKLERRESLKIL